MLKPGVYRIRNVHTGSYIDQSFGTKDLIHGWHHNDDKATNQHWLVLQMADGLGWAIKNVNSHRWLQVDSCKNSTQLKSQPYLCLWDVNPDENGSYHIALAGRNEVIDLDAGNKTDGTLLCVFDYSPEKKWQKWIFEPTNGSEAELQPKNNGW